MWTCFFVMIFIVLFLLLSFGSALIYGVPKSDAPASQLIVLPGINPIIPFWWPAIAFVGALVIHEFAHALQARAHGMRVRSVGLLMLGPFPAGAFVEPEFEELTKTPRRACEVVCCSSGDQHVCRTAFLVAHLSLGQSVLCHQSGCTRKRNY